MVKIGELVIDGLGVVLSNVYTLNITIIYVYVARAYTSIFSSYLNNSSILQAICNFHADATLVRGSLQESHRLLVFYTFHKASFCSILVLLRCVPLLSFCLLFLVQ